MTRGRVLVVALAIGCGGSPPESAPVTGHVETPVARSTPAPTIAWADSAFDTHALPAIARGAEVAVVAVHDGDGGRGYPNLRIEVRDRNDRVIEKIQVMDSNDYETLIDGGQPTAELARRIAAANQALAKQHGLHDLVAMQPIAVQPPSGDALPHLAIGTDLDIDFVKDRLHVFHHNTDRPFRSVDAHAWQAPTGQRCAQCEPCENPAFLHAVYKTAEINALVVEIAYRGTDTCWEPGNQLHFITW